MNLNLNPGTPKQIWDPTLELKTEPWDAQKKNVLGHPTHGKHLGGKLLVWKLGVMRVSIIDIIRYNEGIIILVVSITIHIIYIYVHLHNIIL